MSFFSAAQRQMCAFLPAHWHGQEYACDAIHTHAPAPIPDGAIMSWQRASRSVWRDTRARQHTAPDTRRVCSRVRVHVCAVQCERVYACSPVRTSLSGYNTRSHMGHNRPAMRARTAHITFYYGMFSCRARTTRDASGKTTSTNRSQRSIALQCDASAGAQARVTPRVVGRLVRGAV